MRRPNIIEAYFLLGAFAWLVAILGDLPTPQDGSVARSIINIAARLSYDAEALTGIYPTFAVWRLAAFIAYLALGAIMLFGYRKLREAQR